MTDSFKKIALEISVTEKQVIATSALLEDGATIPFIARYRKELTGGLDEVQIAQIRDRKEELQNLERRREAILKSLKEMGKLDPALGEQVMSAVSMPRLEDIYLPFRPKKKTRGSVAREKGLQPLAETIFEQETADPVTFALAYVNPEKGVNSSEEALAGARDIIAELIAEDLDARDEIRHLFLDKGKFNSRLITGKEESGEKFKDYFEWSELIRTAPSHRVLAVRRGEKEGILWLELRPSEADAIAQLTKRFVKLDTASGQIVKAAVQDSYKRLLGPSMETEVRIISRKKAEQEAIRVFAENVRQLLLAPPLGAKRVMAIDPGFRTGCKVVCLDKQGKLLENFTVQMHTGAENAMEAEKILRNLAALHHIEAIAIGNGTAGRETETFVRKINLEGVEIIMVNESGASIYSASEIARQEFPDKDITVRGAVSIGRRLMDPLAELVKIDARSIGVGQYQHDIDQTLLKASLDDTVISCVNKVGVELNTASPQLLTYVSGLGPGLAQNIVEYRNTNGAFERREDLRKVPRMGDKAYEQAAGFLRIRGGKEILDSSAVHPERYSLVHKMALDVSSNVPELIADENLRKKILLKDYVSDDVGLPTLEDILAELAKPGRDPREEFETFAFTEGVKSIEDLKPGMKLPGIVTNITAFGAFVDIGVHQDGLVHLSQLARRFVQDPNQVVKVHQYVEVTVTEVDVSRKRIALSMKPEEETKAPGPRSHRPAKADLQGDRRGVKPRKEKAGNGAGRPQNGTRRPAGQALRQERQHSNNQTKQDPKNQQPKSRQPNQGTGKFKPAKPKVEEEPELDMAAKLALLKAKFQ